MKILFFEAKARARRQTPKMMPPARFYIQRKEFWLEKVAGRCQFVKSRDQAESWLTLGRSSLPGLREESWRTNVPHLPPLGTPGVNERAAIRVHAPQGAKNDPTYDALVCFFHFRPLVQFSDRPYSVWPISGIDNALCLSVVCVFLTPWELGNWIWVNNHYNRGEVANKFGMF